MTTPNLRRDPGPGHATNPPAARVTGPAAEPATSAPNPSRGRAWSCDTCGRVWPREVPPIQDPTDVAWQGRRARTFCTPDCLTNYSESLGTQP
jgi:hypothetical protein